MPHQVPSPPPDPALEADCDRCVGLCCVAPAFAAGADFAIDKPAGRPCPNLGADDRCDIHERLREEGFPGCVAFDCFGAGQRVSQVTFGGRHWRNEPALAGPMFAAFAVVRPLHELLHHLATATRWDEAGPVRADLHRAATEVEALAAGDPSALAVVDVAALHRTVGPVLDRASFLARSCGGRPGADMVGADLAGADLRRHDLRRADLRGATLLGADLRGADLTRASVLGADLRGADLRGADLATALFLTGPQATSARGDRSTRIPTALTRPVHW